LLPHSLILPRAPTGPRPTKPPTNRIDHPPPLSPPPSNHQGVTKLSDANDAGTRSSGECTLILTEGDSAKSLAMSGLSVVGHDKWGVFPLRWVQGVGCGEVGVVALVVQLMLLSWAHDSLVPPHAAAHGFSPRRGKLLNVRDATASQISENVEIQHIKQVGF
jgi:hypothetical protein